VVLQNAYETDVRPLLMAARAENGRPADPLAALARDEITIERRRQRQVTPPRAGGGGLGA